MSKHTPGPWFLRLRDSANSLYDIANKLPDGGMWHVASCNRLRDEVEANARLISAAPELLRALQTLVMSLSIHGEEGLIEHAEPMQLARAAIAKATKEEA